MAILFINRDRKMTDTESRKLEADIVKTMQVRGAPAIGIAAAYAVALSVLNLLIMQVDTLIQARWIIPVEPHNVILEDHALVTHEGRILDILPVQQAHEKYQAKQLEILADHALIPGLINTHTHLAMTLFRGISADLHLMDWLENHIWPLEKKWVNEAFVRDGTDLAIAEMLRGGTTCFNDMYFFPEITAHQAIHHGIRANVGLILIDFPTAWADGPEHYIEKGLALHEELRHEPLVRTPFAPHAPYTVSDKPLKKISALAEELNLPIHMHVHETQHEVTYESFINPFFF
jgi:5-methylthioadenosine/S-adenosylhomocysteine deaminase